LVSRISAFNPVRLISARFNFANVNVPRKTASIKDPQFHPARTRSEDSGQALFVQREKGLDFNVKGNRRDFVSLTL
jgi:hypothetical protein